MARIFALSNRRLTRLLVRRLRLRRNKSWKGYLRSMINKLRK
jgi:hypothetical protein